MSLRLKLRSTFSAIVLLLNFLSLANAATEMRTGIESGFVLDFHSLPSSMAGVVSFDTPRIRANVEFFTDTGDSLEFIVDPFLPRDATTKKFQFGAEKAAVILSSPFNGEFSIETGVIRNPWAFTSEKLWDFNRWGSEGDPILERNNYLARSELGANFYWDLGEHFDFTAHVANGEAMRADESGLRKDGELILSFQSSNFDFRLGYLRGAYDDYEADVNLKERQMVFLRIHGEKHELQLEAFQSQDTNLVMQGLGIAQGVDVQGLPLQLIRGEGGSAIWISHFNRWVLRLRHDYLIPAKVLTDADMRTSMVGLSYEASMNTTVSFIFFRSDFGENHSLLDVSQSKTLVALTYRM